jgi:MYXO-CTERM domain-containing protein
MRHAAFFAAASVTCLASTAVAGIPQEFGRLTYGSTPINMTSGTGVGNDGYYMNRSTQSFGELLIGIKAHEYRNGNMPAGSSTVSQYGGSGLTTGGSWLNINQSTGAYTAIAGVAANTPVWNPNAPSWGFTWNVSVDGMKAAVGTASMRMIITRPDSVAVTLLTAQDIGSDIAPGTTAWQQNWNFGYLGVFGNGVDANTVGDWKIKIEVFSGSTVFGAQEITVTATPAPGAVALLGLAGAIGGRRRRG